MITTLEWAGCHNARDLGGTPLAGGGTVPRGAAVRALVETWDLPGTLRAGGLDERRLTAARNRLGREDA